MSIYCLINYGWSDGHSQEQSVHIPLRTGRARLRLFSQVTGPTFWIRLSLRNSARKEVNHARLLAATYDQLYAAWTVFGPKLRICQILDIAFHPKHRWV